MQSFPCLGSQSLHPVQSGPTGSSLDFLLQEALHNTSILPSKDAPFQSSYPMLIVLLLVPSTRPGPLQRLECLLNKWMNNKAKAEPITSHLMLTCPSTLARAIVSFSLKSPCPR